MGEPMTIDEARRVAGAAAIAAEDGTTPLPGAVTRDALATLAAEVDRLTIERDAALANTRTMVAALDDLASANAERDRLAAALAEVREAVEEIASHGEREPGPTRGMGHDLRAVLVATPADLAAAHDARVRVEERQAYVEELTAWDLALGERPPPGVLHIDRTPRPLTEDEWARVRAEAERIGGGR